MDAVEQREGGVSYEVRIDRDVCIGAGNCEATAPEGFALDEDAISVTLPGVKELSDEQLLAVAHGCPSGAIRLFSGDVEVEIP